MSASYRFLLSGSPDADKSGLLFALLRQSPHTEQRIQEREFSLESEQYRYTLIERGAPDEVAQYLLKEAARLDALVLCVNAASTQQPQFESQLALLQNLSVPLHAIVLTKTSAFSDHTLAQLEKNLLQTLKRYDLFCEKFVLLRYTHEDQAQLAKSLLDSLDARVSFTPSRPSPDALPLRLFLRPRRRTIRGQAYYLASLTQGALACGDTLINNSWRGDTKVAGLALAHDPETPLSQVRAGDASIEIFFAVSGSLGTSQGELISGLQPLPSVHRCRALVYLPAASMQAIETKQPTQIEARFAPIYKSITLRARLNVSGGVLVPGGFALAELQNLSGNLFVEPGMFFTWQTPSSYPGARLEAVGRVIAVL
jgi:hypothetical protein